MEFFTAWVLVVFLGPNNIVTVDDIVSRQQCEALADEFRDEYRRDYYVTTKCFSVRKAR